MQIDLTLADDAIAHLRLSAAALTISLGPDLVYTLDRSGRVIGVFADGRNLRRGLDGRVLARWRDDTGVRRREWLGAEESEGVLRRMGEDLTRVMAANPPPALASTLTSALAFDYAADIARFHQVYRPVSILPPDQYQALVMQATEGCSFNTCTFCALYRDRAFRIKQPDEFAKHIAAVQAFFGAGISMRRSIFLADANALIVPQARLLPLFDCLAAAFAFMPAELAGREQAQWLRAHPAGMSGVFAFVDGLSAERKSEQDFAELRERGLRRVYIGLESGHEPLLEWLRKPCSAADMIEAVVRMKEAGLQVGVIVMVGVGGQRFSAGHIADTAAALNSMPLTGDDIIYFSPFQPDPDSPYEDLAAAADIVPPTPEFTRKQERAMRASITLPPPLAGPKRVPYNLADFVY
ncbi:MAG: radical SAM protein [Caldilineales bacterium]|nr:radical SAM protein [Caldilineales bacterium]